MTTWSYPEPVGRRPELTDSELICLAVAQVLLGYHRERRWVRHVRTDPELLAMFPSMLTQSAYHKRLKTAQPLLSKAILVLAACCPSRFDDLWIQWAFCSLLPSGWAREFYDGKIAAGKSHHAALRALSNRWLKVLWHCLTKGVLYDEAVHIANRNQALGHAA